MHFGFRSRALRAFSGIVLALLLFAPSAHAAKNHCRKISFDGVAGVLSQDVVNFQVARPDATVVNLSDTFQVAPNESAIDFLKRLPSVWCTEDGDICPNYDPLDLPKKICADSQGLPSCSLKLKIAPKNGPVYKKKYVEVCCFEQPLCKTKLGSSNPAEVPITIQAQVNAGAECPPDNQLPSGVSTCTVNLDPIGVVQYPHPALSKCRAAVAKSLSSYFNTATLALVKCHVVRDEGKIDPGTDCNTFAGGDINGLIAGAAASLTSTLQLCGNDGSPASFGYSGCPAPCELVPTGDCTAGLIGQPCTADRDCDTSSGSLDGRCGDWNAVSDCLSCLTEAAVTTAVADKLGNPPVPIADASVLKCRGLLAKLLAEIVSTRLKETSSCQKKLDAGKLVLPDANTTCLDYDPKGTLAALASKVTDNINKACTGVDLTQVESCSTTDPTSLAACFSANGDLVNAAFAGAAFPESRPRSAGTCPTSLRLVAAAGIGHTCEDDADCIPGNCLNGRCVNPTELDIGSSGALHGADINDGTALDLGLSCAAGEAPCGICTISGIDAAKRSMCRCANDAALTCDEPFVADVDDCGGAQCQCFSGTPLPLAGGGTALCATRQLEGEPGGSIDVDTSNMALDLAERWRIHLPISQTSPCPQCAAGVCTGGQRAGLPCTDGAQNAAFGPTSLDCPPSAASNVSAAGLLVATSASTGTATLGASLPCDPPFVGLCPCGVCSLDPLIGCSNDGDCPPGTGTCGQSSAGLRVPNACDDLTCNPTGDPARGACGAGPIDTYCDGITHADGRGLISCVDNADCAAFGATAGNCTLSENRRCFLDQIQAAGFGAVSTARIVSATCLAPSTSVAINGQAGLPGALRQSTLYRPLPACGDGVSQYVPGVGGCP